jgi:hypothetical protein
MERPAPKSTSLCSPPTPPEGGMYKDNPQPAPAYARGSGLPMVACCASQPPSFLRPDRCRVRFRVVYLGSPLIPNIMGHEYMPHHVAGRPPSGCPLEADYPPGGGRFFTLSLSGWRGKRHFIPSTVFLTGLRSFRRSLRTARLPDGIRFTGCNLGSPLFPQHHGSRIRAPSCFGASSLRLSAIADYTPWGGRLWPQPGSVPQ